MGVGRVALRFSYFKHYLLHVTVLDHWSYNIVDVASFYPYMKAEVKKICMRSGIAFIN
jgi:hypothetical protein